VSRHESARRRARRPEPAGPPAFSRIPKFRCLTDGTKPAGKDFFIFDRSRKKLQAAVQMTESGDVSAGYPVGTILQIFPFEAMVKRKPGFNPDGDDWEFFQLKVEQGKHEYKTVVVDHGKNEITNFAGSCQNWHAGLAKSHDLVCGFVIGAAGLGLTDAQIAAAHASDPRCK
jgi:hypothetical protein